MPIPDRERDVRGLATIGQVDQRTLARLSFLIPQTSQKATIPANLYLFCCGGAAGRSGPRTTILHNETAYSKMFSCRPPGYVQAGLPGRFQVRQLERKEEMKPDPSDDERFV